MLINENLSTENDEGKLSTVVKVKNKINCKNEKYQAQGVQTMGDLLKSYKKPDNIDDLDIHLYSVEGVERVFTGRCELTLNDHPRFCDSGFGICFDSSLHTLSLHRQFRFDLSLSHASDSLFLMERV